MPESSLASRTPEGQPSESAGPCGTGNQVVQPGDCMASIALEQGFFWETLWNHPGNGPLRRFRDDPHALLPGDRVCVPEKRRKDEPGQTEMRHRFVRRGEPSILRATFLNHDDTPRAGEPYRLEVDGHPFVGELDECGTLEVRIPGTARRAVVRLGVAPLEDHFHLRLGALDPISTPSGVHARLLNLGHVRSAASSADKIPEAVVAEYQRSRELTVTGQLDEGTRRDLERKHFAD
ncbi:MAG: hypothetical protein U1D55_02805 [Phycisphaerae bacterium]